MIETLQNLSRRQRELLEEFERVSDEKNNPESTGFFARVRVFLDAGGEVARVSAADSRYSLGPDTRSTLLSVILPAVFSPKCQFRFVQ